MGLGTKIKQALSGDKKQSTTAQRRKTAAPIYPEPVQIPRSGPGDTFQPGAINKPLPDTRHDSPLEEEEYQEYTHTPVDSRPAAPEVAPPEIPAAQEAEEDEDEVETPLTMTTDKPMPGRFPRETKDYPYWGDVHKREAAAAHEDKDSGIFGTDPANDSDEFLQRGGHQQHASLVDGSRGTYGTPVGVARSGLSPVNGHPALRGADQNQQRGVAVSSGGAVPTGNVTSGRPVLVDDAAARAMSMAASESFLSQPPSLPSLPKQQVDEDFGATPSPDYTERGNTWSQIDVNNAHHVAAHESVVYDPVGVSMAARGGAGDAQGWGALPPREPAQQQQQQHRLNKTGTGFESDAYNNNYGGPRNNTFPRDAGVDGNNRGWSPGSPVVNNNNNNNNGSDGLTTPKAADPPHYGPGHSGARVLHRCQHCGGDNDITRYFSKDVVYRLS